MTRETQHDRPSWRALGAATLQTLSSGGWLANVVVGLVFLLITPLVGSVMETKTQILSIASGLTIVLWIVALAMIRSLPDVTGSTAVPAVHDPNVVAQPLASVEPAEPFSPPAVSALTERYATFLGKVKNGFLIAAGVQGQSYFHPERKQTVFSAFFADAMNGAADLDGDGRITVAELERFLFNSIDAYSRKALLRGLEPPVFVNNGDQRTVLLGSRVPFRKAIGVLVGIGDYDDGIDAEFSNGGAIQFVNVLSFRIGLSAERLLGGEANKARVLAALQKAAASVTQDDLLIVVFAGWAELNQEKPPHWVLYSPQGDDTLTASAVADILEKASARYTLVVMDCSLASDEFRRRLKLRSGIAQNR